MDLDKLDLRKAKVLDLQKKAGLETQKAQVVLCLDYSGSMSSLYHYGEVQELVERILPLGLAFDDNGEVEFYLFEDGVSKVEPNITLANVDGFIDREVMNGKYQMGGTNYAPVIKRIVKDFSESESSGGFMGIGGTKTFLKSDLPTYVIFITDGENADHSEAEKAIIEASNTGIFFQFVGIGNTSFNFLKKLDTMSGRNIDNANFFAVPNLATQTDDDLYAFLLGEFPSFVTEARAKGLIN